MGFRDRGCGFSLRHHAGQQELGACGLVGHLKPYEARERALQVESRRSNVTIDTEESAARPLDARTDHATLHNCRQRGHLLDTLGRHIQAVGFDLGFGEQFQQLCSFKADRRSRPVGGGPAALPVLDLVQPPSQYPGGGGRIVACQPQPGEDGGAGDVVVEAVKEPFGLLEASLGQA